MTQNKKLFSVFTFFVLLPLLVSYFNNFLSEQKNIAFSHDNRWIIAMAMYIISLLGSVGLIVKANQSEYRIIWITVGILGVVVFGAFAYLTYSFSNFGF